MTVKEALTKLRLEFDDDQNPVLALLSILPPGSDIESYKALRFAARYLDESGHTCPDCDGTNTLDGLAEWNSSRKDGAS